MSEFKDWYRNVPFFTRTWLTLTIVFSLIGRFGLVNPYYLLLDFYPFVFECQIWRPLTAAFYYPIGPGTGFHFLINCYFLYTYSQRLETGMFQGKPADYLYMLLFNWVCCVIIGLMINVPLIMDPLVLSVLYVWCQLNKDVVVSFWFGTRFKAMYLPWVLLAFNMILSGGGAMELVGILIGHLSFFLQFKYPQEFGGPAILTPPAFLKRMFPDSRFVGGFGTAPQAVGGERARPGDTMFGGHHWGRGQVLGGN
ncbi:derlin-1 [Ostrinia nubilalis]|uniref:derlin-1 n=1 Tax=Ostrinia furnacalis TaxID=93504 RepID=UPI00103BE0CD|nr:derlin-1 [Ostrinia furnacalis]